MAHLFIGSYTITGSLCIVTDPAICHQLTRVLRMNVGDFLFIQQNDGSGRYSCTLQQIAKDHITLCLEEQCASPGSPPRETTLFVALPNKLEKIELITQKAAEIGIGQLVFWPAQRSVLQDISPKKLERLHIIIREATEQSRGWHMMKIGVYPTFPKELLGAMQCVVFDYHEEYTLPKYVLPDVLRGEKGSLKGGIIGPEGGFTEQERQNRNDMCQGYVTLGSTVLRTETAAIIGSWRITSCG